MIENINVRIEVLGQTWMAWSLNYNGRRKFFLTEMR